MPRLCRIAALSIVALPYLLSAQTTLEGDLNVVERPGVFLLDFDISAPCPTGITSAHGRARICGHNNTVTLSVDGAPAFPLLPGGPSSGLQGPAGQAATVTVGTVLTLPPGSPATIFNSGTSTDAILNFGIPQGDPGGTQECSNSAGPVDYALVTETRVTQAGSNTWAMPGALTELFGGILRLQADLTSAGCARSYVYIGDNIGPIGAAIYFEYSVDEGRNWFRLTLDTDISTYGPHVSPWWAIPSDARRDVLVRAVSANGTNTSVDILAVHLQVNGCSGAAGSLASSKMRRSLVRSRAKLSSSLTSD